jgi:hypothetical protein
MHTTPTTRVVTEDPFAVFAPIGLDELNQQAGLQTRMENKYVVPAEELESILAAVDPEARVLEIGGRLRFGYESTYFDTPQLTSYLATAQGRRRRFKLRTRVYADTGECWFEVKTKGWRGITVKHRLPYSLEHHEVVTAPAREFADRHLGEAFVDVDTSSLSPTLRTAYDRTTLLLPASRSRVTVDRDLRWEAASGRLWVGDYLVLETKTTPGADTDLDRALWSLGHRPVQLSKYGTGLSLLWPDLPGNKWHRLRHLDFP